MGEGPCVTSLDAPVSRLLGAVKAARENWEGDMWYPSGVARILSIEEGGVRWDYSLVGLLGRIGGEGRTSGAEAGA